MSPLMRGRELKQVEQDFLRSVESSPLMRGRELKPNPKG